MRRQVFVGLFAWLVGCGFNPTPKDGKLPCDHGCPDGYTCHADNRCYRTGPTVDSGSTSDGALANKDIAVVPEVAGGEAGDSANKDIAVVPEVAGGEAGDSSDGPGSEPKPDSAADGTPADLAAEVGQDAPSPGLDTSRVSEVAGAEAGDSSDGPASDAKPDSAADGTPADLAADVGQDAPSPGPDASCVPETDQEICARLGKNCNAISVADNCGQTRSIASCGTCAANRECGTFVPNVCPPLCIFDQSTFDNCVFDE